MSAPARAATDIDVNAFNHLEAMSLVRGAAGTGMLSYEQAIAIYLRARAILRDDAISWGSPIPANWKPPIGERL